MITTLFRANYVAAIVMGVALCFAFTATAQAEEVSSGPGYAAKQQQLQELKEKVAQMRSSMNTTRKENNEAAKKVIAEKKQEYQETKSETKAAFLEQIADLNSEDRKEAIMKYVSELREQIAARKTELQEKRAEQKQERLRTHAEFQTALEGLSPVEKLKAIQERLEAVRKQQQERKQKLSEALEDEDESEEESEDESEEEEDGDESEDEELDDESSDDDEEV